MSLKCGNYCFVVVVVTEKFIDHFCITKWKLCQIKIYQKSCTFSKMTVILIWSTIFFPLQLYVFFPPIHFMTLHCFRLQKRNCWISDRILPNPAKYQWHFFQTDKFVLIILFKWISWILNLLYRFMLLKYNWFRYSEHLNEGFSCVKIKLLMIRETVKLWNDFLVEFHRLILH